MTAAGFLQHRDGVFTMPPGQAALFRGGVATQILTIGGGQTGDATTEGQAGRQALIDAGIPAGSVTAVGVGNDTLVSLRAAALVLDRRGWTSVVWLAAG